MTKKILPVAAMEKLLKKAGAHRVSLSAKEALREFLEDIGEKIGEKAIRMAKHSKRKTIKKEDIKEAAR